MRDRMRVELIKDLTLYDSHLYVGARGYADLTKTEINDWEQEMFLCKFPNVDPLQIGLNALNIIDKEYWDERERDVKQAEYIELCEGPRGGFKYLRIYSKDRKGNKRIYTINVKHIANRILEINEGYNREIKKVIKSNQFNRE